MDAGRLDIGYVASHGHFYYQCQNDQFCFERETKPVTGFPFKLIAQLQFSGTVPMIDIDAYTMWLTKD